MLPFFLIILSGGAASNAATPTDNAERYIRPNPQDGGTVSTRMRPVLPTN